MILLGMILNIILGKVLLIDIIYCRNKNCTISCVKEIVDLEYKTCLVAIAVNMGNCTGMIYIFMVKGSKIIGKIEVNENITCIEYIDSLTCNRGILNQYKGCVAVGTETGKICIIDLCLAYLDEDGEYISV